MFEHDRDQLYELSNENYQNEKMAIFVKSIFN